MNSSYLVPTDFSEASNKAIEYAVKMAEPTKAKIALVNFCNSESEANKSRENLEKQAANFKFSSPLELVVKVGTYKDIPVVADERGADLIFLGTHGAKGMQKVLGLNALKIVTSSSVPFIIVQKDSPVCSGFKKILVTTSFHFENKQKIQAVGIIAKYFNSEINFIYSDADSITKAKSLNNVSFMKKHLDKLNIKYEIHKSSSKSFNADTIELGSEINANLIAIMNMQKEDILGTGLFGNNYEQELIMNEAQIPILIINPNHSTLLDNILGSFII